MMRISRIGCLVLVVGWVLFCLCMVPESTFVPFAMALYTFVGWAFFLYRIAPEMGLSYHWLMISLFGLTLFTVGLQAFFAKAYGTDRWRWRWTFAIVAGAMLVFMAGIGTSGAVYHVARLFSSPEVWVYRGGMEPARRAQSVNNMKQIGLATANYESANSTLPPGVTMAEYGVLLHGWQTMILPYMELYTLFDRIDLQKPWDDPVNLPVFREPVYAYLSPAIRENGFPGPYFSHYEGNVRVVGGTRGSRLAEITDGFNNTILAGEVAGDFQPWGKPGQWRDTADGINRDHARGFGSRFPGGATFVFLDGSVKFLKNTIDLKVLKALGTPAGGEVVSSSAY